MKLPWPATLMLQCPALCLVYYMHTLFIDSMKKKKEEEERIIEKNIYMGEGFKLFFGNVKS